MCVYRLFYCTSFLQNIVCFLHLILIISFHFVSFRLRNTNTNRIAALLGSARAARRLLRFLSHLAIVLHSLAFSFHFIALSGVCAWSCVMCFLLLDVCGCKYRQCFTGFFHSVSGFTFFLLEKRSFLLFFLYLISYCLALSFSESTSRRSRRATQNYWELTTLSLSLDLLVLVVFFLICFCRRHAKRAKHQILSEWGLSFS